MAELLGEQDRSAIADMKRMIDNERVGGGRIVHNEIAREGVQSRYGLPNAEYLRRQSGLPSVYPPSAQSRDSKEYRQVVVGSYSERS